MDHSSCDKAICQFPSSHRITRFFKAISGLIVDSSHLAVYDIDVIQIKSSTTLMIDTHACGREVGWTAMTMISLTNWYNSTEVIACFPTQLPLAAVSEIVTRLIVARRRNLKRLDFTLNTLHPYWLPGNGAQGFNLNCLIEKAKLVCNNPHANFVARQNLSASQTLLSYNTIFSWLIIYIIQTLWYISTIKDF